MKHDARTQAAIDAGHPEWAALPSSPKEAWAAGSTLFFNPKPCRRAGHIAPRQRSRSNCTACENPSTGLPGVRPEIERPWEFDDDPTETELLLDALQFGSDLPRREAAALLACDVKLLDLPETRDAAICKGATRYFPGKVCSKGHIASRFTAGGDHDCVECDRLRNHTQPYRAKQYAHSAHRRAIKIDATPPWLNTSQKAGIADRYDEATLLTIETGVVHHVDHIVPLNHPDVCGWHVPWNLQVLRYDDNARKHNAFDGTMENEGWRALPRLSQC